jgi:hypothetical protein
MKVISVIFTDLLRTPTAKKPHCTTITEISRIMTFRNSHCLFWETNSTKQELIVAQLVKKFPACRGTRRFITVFTRARHLSLPWTTWIQFKLSHPIYLRFILIFSSNLCLLISNDLLTSVFGLNLVYIFISSIHATRPLIISFDLIIPKYLLKIINYEAPHYTVFTWFLLLL